MSPDPINNMLDIGYYTSFAMYAKKSATWLWQQQHFECVGHGYHIAYGLLVSMISDAIDPQYAFIPNARAWDARFQKLAEIKQRGFFHGSPIEAAPLGIHAIYEGQARFIQLQFLDGTSDDPVPTQVWRDGNLLFGIYIEAFELFLRLTESEWPASMRDSLVGLFLLVCDIAINPTRGFPLDIDVEGEEYFIYDVDVGIRFCELCHTIAKHPELKSAIQDYSRAEYIEVSGKLALEAGFDHPLGALTKISKWMDSDAVRALMAEHATFKFEKNNLPVRVMLSHFLSFSNDRLQHPHFFCWPGIWLTRSNQDRHVRSLWLKHLSLFADHKEKPGVYPRRWPNRSEAATKDMFNSFYGSMAFYDLTRQWVCDEGDFELDFRWMFENYSQDVANQWCDDTFKRHYGVSLGDFQILPPST